MRMPAVTGVRMSNGPGSEQSRPTTTTDPRNEPPVRKIFGVHPLKFVFAMEYVLQGLANPFQGITYQPFFRHFRTDYGLSEAATQGMFSKSYLAWSFKPILGFLIDAYGKTRTILLLLLTLGVLGFLLTPLIDTGPMVFFGFMFALSIVMAATDVSVDRATVIAGDEEAKATGRSKATMVGLNQAICWTAIYGTGILAAILGGYTAEHIPFSRLMVVLAIVPATVLVFVLLLPRDRVVPIPLKESVLGFWRGLHRGPILGVILFYFIFHFQPAMGALWNNYLIESLRFSQTQIGISDGVTYAGYFLGVLLFAWKGVHWQERMGLRAIFRIFILISVGINLTQYLLVDPWFSAIAHGLHNALPFLSEEHARLVYLSAYNGFLAIAVALIRMSTFSLVGAVIPVAAAGSLFAGFMSVSNLAYSFCYSTGAWLYEHGLNYGFIRALQSALFGLPGQPGGELSINMLILIGSLAYLLSFVGVHLLPDRKQTRATELDDDSMPGPERWDVLARRRKLGIDWGTLALGLAFVPLAIFRWKFDPISAVLCAFFGLTMLRRAVLDGMLRRRVPAGG
jgi:MFS family permease